MPSFQSDRPRVSLVLLLLLLLCSQKVETDDWYYLGIIPQDFFLVKFHRVSQHRRSAQALSILGSSSAQLAHPLA
jgi:hypothetical protein